jgi:hypothetical protein
MIRSASLISAGCVFFAAAAHAGGSLGLDEVLAAVAKSPKLVAEIQAELDKNGLKVGEVVCWGLRFGRQWEYLGGGRAAPYECKIGQRTITIEADRVFFDAWGKSLGRKLDYERAATFKESNFRWTWAQ